MEKDTERRIARNEAAFREVNESIERGRWPGEERSPAVFRCECAQLECTVLLELTVQEYERVRSDPRHFLVARGHHVPEEELVVQAFDNYLIVRKRGEAGRIAEQQDPRS